MTWVAPVLATFGDDIGGTELSRQLLAAPVV
jgi:hypothetical protein